MANQKSQRVNLIGYCSGLRQTLDLYILDFNSAVIGMAMLICTRRMLRSVESMVCEMKIVICSQVVVMWSGTRSAQETIGFAHPFVSIPVFYEPRDGHCDQWAATLTHSSDPVECFSRQILIYSASSFILFFIVFVSLNEKHRPKMTGQQKHFSCCNTSTLWQFTRGSCWDEAHAPLYPHKQPHSAENSIGWNARCSIKSRARAFERHPFFVPLTTFAHTCVSRPHAQHFLSNIHTHVLFVLSSWRAVAGLCKLK